MATNDGPNQRIVDEWLEEFSKRLRFHYTQVEIGQATGLKQSTVSDHINNPRKLSHKFIQSCSANLPGLQACYAEYVRLLVPGVLPQLTTGDLAEFRKMLSDLEETADKFYSQVEQIRGYLDKFGEIIDGDENNLMV